MFVYARETAATIGGELGDTSQIYTCDGARPSARMSLYAMSTSAGSTPRTSDESTRSS